jgi:hypothetical protein
MQMLYDSDSFAVMHMAADAAPQASAGEPTQALAGQGERLRGGGATRERGADATVALPALVRHGFEIVDKRSGKEVYLDGSWAELFQQQIEAWQRNTPSQEEVEDTLDRYAALATNPVVMH